MNHCHDCNSDYSAPGTCNCFAAGGKREPARTATAATSATITTTVRACQRCGYVHGVNGCCPLSPGPYTWISLPQIPTDAVTVYLSDNSQPPPAP